MKNKGFTLVELIACIAIMVIVLMVSVPTLINNLDKQKEKSSEKIYDLIKTAARNYAIDYQIDSGGIIPIEDLCDRYIDCPIINPSTEEEITGYIFVGDEYIYSETGTVTVKLDLDEGNSSQALETSQVPNTTITLEEPTKAGCAFSGWEIVSGSGIISGNNFTVGNTNVEIKANYGKLIDSVETIKNLYQTDASNNGLYEPMITIDGVETSTGIRYAGSNESVKNYVEFNGETWRIIGVFETEKSDGTTEELIKIVRDENLLSVSWDSSDSTINDGVGVNEWSQADLQNMLNTYYIGTSTTCTYCNGKGQATCSNDCTSSVTPLTNTFLNMIENVVWKTGAKEWVSAMPVSDMYIAERGTQDGKDLCESGGEDDCNDAVSRTTRWTGKVGLIYPSDYGYASTDESCFTDIVNSDSTCENNNWLHPSSGYYWTILPYAHTIGAGHVWRIGSSVSVNDSNAYGLNGVHPSLYLKSSVKFIEGSNGTSDSPYKLYLEN